MWMTGYGGDGGEINLPDSFNGRKFRPLIPRPSSTSISTTPTNPPCLSRIHGSDLLVLNHHLATVADQSKREYSTQQQVVVSSRWNPTPEQLQTLEELYRRGTRTPSADQIQHITAQLRRYGKIEGKNVFYWFQNHKARERQKRRRQLESSAVLSDRETETAADRKESANKTGFEVEQTKSWALSTNCSTTLAEKTAPIQRAAGVPECRTDGWVQFPEEELQQRKSLLERNATWQMMQFSSSPPTHTLINPTAAAAYTVTTTTNSQTVRKTPPKLLKGSRDLNKFLTHYGEDVNLVIGGQDRATEAVSESQTLQLFPLGRDEGNGNITDETEMSNGAMDSNFTPYQFFEFLPLKN